MTLLRSLSVISGLALLTGTLYFSAPDLVVDCDQQVASTELDSPSREHTTCRLAEVSGAIPRPQWAPAVPLNPAENALIEGKKSKEKKKKRRGKKKEKKRSKKEEKSDGDHKAASRFMRAYEAIKKQRLEFISKYTDDLLDIATRCAEVGLKESGKSALKRVLLLYKPRETRPRLTTKSAGVIAGAEVQVGPLIRKTRRQLSPADKKQARKARARYKKVKKALKKSEDSFADAVERGKAQAAIESALKDKRKGFIQELSNLANRCVDRGFPAQGYEVIQWTLQFDDENARLRKALRQFRFDDKRTKKTKWYSPYDYAKAKKGYIDHPKYGWVTPKGLKQIEKGLAKFKGKWRPVDYVDTQRQKWANRWVHETEHFEIHTNAPLEDAVYFGREVEKLYSFFFRVWVDFYALDNPKLARQLVLQGGKDLGRRKLRIHYHRSRESYIWEAENDPHLKTVGNIELTKRSAGFYWGGNGRSYFYRVPTGPNLRTIYHEVTHQIFGETYPNGPRPPVWLVEGLAVFMEDPAVRGDYERGTERFLVGTERPVGVKENDVRDINRFVKQHFNDEAFHGGNRHDNYMTGGAVVHFFMLYRDGIHRKGFIRYARAAYRNTLEETPTPASKLYDFLGVTEDDLQTQWEEFNEKPDLFDF